MEGVSFVIPVRNGARWLPEVLQAISAQDDGRPFELIVVDDGSTDDTPTILRRLTAAFGLRVLQGAGRGAAAAINLGVRAARCPIVCQVDQDVIVKPGWLHALLETLEDPSVAAAQGYYESHPDAGLCARVMNRDLEQRYAAIATVETDHVCTGTVAYRASALHAIGLFDESLGYGYDNDLSYRLREAGFRLALCPSARSVHRWREGLVGYAVQQYGFGYGRLDVVAKHPRRFAGDRVSPWLMMAHAPLLAVALIGVTIAAAMPTAASRLTAVLSLSILAALVVERSLAGVFAAWRFRDPAPLAFPVVHLLRDVAWVAAMCVWVFRRVTRRPPSPAQSMRTRPNSYPAAPGRGGSVARPDLDHAARQTCAVAPASTDRSLSPARILCLIPAHNEAANLEPVVSEARALHPHLDFLVIDDGSTDGTPAVLRRLGTQWLRFPERLGIGSAMRAGLRYAGRQGYELVVRMDGDGQHRAQDLDRLIQPILDERADVVIGSRYTDPAGFDGRPGRIIARGLALCLSGLTGDRVTDPTSGFCAMGPRALRVIAEYHPSGYAEPELRLFLSRNSLRMLEVPVRARSRLSGRTSLNAGRVTGAAARALLAMIVVPLRPTVGDAGD